MFWEIRSFPKCEHHAFLSHSREDHDPLVRPVFDQLAAAGVTAWIDRHHYPYGRTSRTALQDGILLCRHTAFFVTDAMLRSARGWCVLELAFAEILQANLTHPGRELLTVSLPLFFVPPADPLLPRTVWQTVRDRGHFFDPSRSADPVAWAVDEVTRFLRREQEQAKRLRATVRADEKLRLALPLENGLRQRVTRFDPQPLPLAGG